MSLWKGPAPTAETSPQQSWSILGNGQTVENPDLGNTGSGTPSPWVTSSKSPSRAGRSTEAGWPQRPQPVLAPAHHGPGINILEEGFSCGEGQGWQEGAQDMNGHLLPAAPGQTPTPGLNHLCSVDTALN